MTMSGDLQTMSIADVLAYAGARRGGAVITVESHQRRKEIRLASGRVVSCTTGTVKERLGQRLIAGDRIRESVLISALAEQDEHGGRLGDILVQRRHIDSSQLGSELTQQGQAALDDLFTWEAGSFTLRPSGQQDDLSRIIEVSCTDVILSGCERADRVRRIRSVLADTTVRFRVDPARYPPGFPRTKLEAGLIHLVLQGLSAAEACMHRHEDDFVVQWELARLVEQGLLQPIVSQAPVAGMPCPEILREAERLVREGAWERAMTLLQAGATQHGPENGLDVATVRLRVRSREKLSWAGGLDVVPILSPTLQEQGITGLGGAERVVAMRVDGSRPLRAIVRGCPVDEDLAFAAFAGLFERGLLHLRPRRSQEPPALVAAPPVPAVSAAPHPRRSGGWEPPPRSR